MAIVMLHVRSSEQNSFSSEMFFLFILNHHGKNSVILTMPSTNTAKILSGASKVYLNAENIYLILLFWM